MITTTVDPEIKPYPYRYAVKYFVQREFPRVREFPTKKAAQLFLDTMIKQCNVDRQQLSIELIDYSKIVI
jgi:hypothetical protein